MNLVDLVRGDRRNFSKNSNFSTSDAPPTLAGVAETTKSSFGIHAALQQESLRPALKPSPDAGCSDFEVFHRQAGPPAKVAKVAKVSRFPTEGLEVLRPGPATPATPTGQTLVRCSDCADMVYGNIDLTWYGEDYRRDRLLQVLGYVLAVKPECLEKVGGLHDHKGTLTVTWRDKPYGGDEAAFALAWEGLHEVADTVEHVVVEERRKKERRLGAAPWDLPTQQALEQAKVPAAHG
jgi:hypothetical protein